MFVAIDTRCLVELELVVITILFVVLFVKREIPRKYITCNTVVADVCRASQLDVILLPAAVVVPCVVKIKSAQDDTAGLDLEYSLQYPVPTTTVPAA